MGVRLYPAGAEDQLIEIWAGVSAETMQRLMRFRELTDEISDLLVVEPDEDVDYEFYRLINLDKALRQLQDFRSEGWGKLNQEQFSLIKAAGFDENYGSTEDPEFIRKLLAAKQVQADPLPTKLSWG